MAQPGSMPEVKHETAAVGARLLERPAQLGGDVRREDERHDGARDDVLPGAQDPRHVVDGLGGPQVGGRGVADAVGVEREQRVDVVRRGDTERRDAGELARVTPRLLGAVHPEPDELELRVLDDEAQRVDARRCPCSTG